MHLKRAVFSVYLYGLYKPVLIVKNMRKTFHAPLTSLSFLPQGDVGPRGLPGTPGNVSKRLFNEMKWNKSLHLIILWTEVCWWTRASCFDRKIRLYWPLHRHRDPQWAKTDVQYLNISFPSAHRQREDLEQQHLNVLHCFSRCCVFSHEKLRGEQTAACYWWPLSVEPDEETATL